MSDILLLTAHISSQCKSGIGQMCRREEQITKEYSEMKEEVS